MYSSIYKKYGILFIFLISTIFSCTSEFEEFNSNPVKIQNGSLEQDNMSIGSKFSIIFEGVVNTKNWSYQTGQNLCADSWVRYLATPRKYAGGFNNTTYRINWSDAYWNVIYEKVMVQSERVLEEIDKKENNRFDEFKAWAILIRVIAISRLTSLHGPVIYSHYGESALGGMYDSEEKLYNTIFEELNYVSEVFEANIEYRGFKKFDPVYEGVLSKWLKVVNTIRLRLAVRLSHVFPEKAQTQAEIACSNKNGLILSNQNNLSIPLNGDKHPLAAICFDWDDTRMSSAMESFLIGLKDNRLYKYFNPVENSLIYKLCGDHVDYPFKGIRNGAELESKDARVGFSEINSSFKEELSYTIVTASEVFFLLAEAKLRGWNVTNRSVEELYSEGVVNSFKQWNSLGANDYLNDSVSTPLDYNDPVATGKINDFISRSKITVAWNEQDPNSVKLERIITQKWIAGFPDSFEAWVDFRRTGYPKLPYNYQNDSNERDGVIGDNDFIKRMRFVPEEIISNPDGVRNAILILNGPDLISTPLWWDVDDPNF